jgi:hypothetical protein
MIFLPDTAPVNEPDQGFLVKKPLRVRLRLRNDIQQRRSRKVKLAI